MWTTLIPARKYLGQRCLLLYDLTFTYNDSDGRIALIGIPSTRIQSDRIAETRPCRRRACDVTRCSEIRNLHGPVLIFEPQSGGCRCSRGRKPLCHADVCLAGSIHYRAVVGARREYVNIDAMVLPWMLLTSCNRGWIQGTVSVCRCSCLRQASERVPEQLSATG